MHARLAVVLVALSGCVTAHPYSPTRVGVLLDFTANGEVGAPPVTGLVRSEFMRVLVESLKKDNWDVIDLSDDEHAKDAKLGAIEQASGWGAAYVLHGNASFTSAKMTGMMEGTGLFPVLGTYSLQLVSTRERTVLTTSEGKLPVGRANMNKMLISFDKTAVSHVVEASQAITAPFLEALKAARASKAASPGS